MAKFVPVKLAYFIADPETEADENLSPIIFLHGMTGWKEHWVQIPQKVANASKRKAYVVDQRNHGDTEWTDEFNIDMLAPDLLHFMDVHEIKKAILVGMSMGGTVAIDVALTHPERVEGLFVVDMTVGKYSESLVVLIKSGMTRFHNILKQIPRDTEAEQVIQVMSEEMQKMIPEGLIGRGVKEQMIDSYVGLLKRQENGQWSSRANIPVLIKALDNPDTLMSDPEGTYRGPTTFIYGTESILDFSTNEARIKQHFPEAKMVPVEGSSHNIIADCPDVLQKTLLEFVSQI